MGCMTSKQPTPPRDRSLKNTPSIQVETASEHEEISKVYREMARDPNGFFVKRDHKKCFLKNN